MHIQYIYKITNLINEKFYIGRTKEPEVRFWTHKNLLDREKHFNIHLQRSWNKYGAEHFLFEIIHEINEKNEEDSVKKAQEIEQEYIDKYYKSGMMYNRSISSVTGVTVGEQHGHYGKHPHEWMGEGWERGINTLKAKTGEKNHFYGRHHTEETKQILREKCANYGESNGFYGKQHSDETKKKISEKKKGQQAHNAIRIVIDGETYNSLKQASEKTGISTYKIKKRLKNDDFPSYYII